MATILVEILGSAAQFKSELDGAVRSTEKASGGFKKLGIIAAGAGAAIAGGVVVGLTKSVEAAVAAQEATARLNTAFDASHVSMKQFAGAIENAEGKARKLGFTNEDVKGSLGSLIVATHNGHKAIADLGVAQDIARFKHVSLETATKSLTMAMAGSQRATKALGIDVPKVTTSYDALKATMGKTIDPAEKLELAHAKLQDRMATANKVIATVSEKLHGQAQAFSDTAAGGMAAFHAQLQNIEEQVGAKLLPVLTRFLSWLTAELPVAVAEAKRVIAFLTPYFMQVKTAVETVVAAVRSHWTQISQILKEVVDVIRTELNLFGDLIHGRWGQIWDDLVKIGRAAVALLITVIKDIGPTILAALEELGRQAVRGLKAGLEALPGALETTLKALPGLALKGAELVGQAIVAGVKWAVPHIAGLAGDLTGMIASAISQVASWALGEAEKIGKSIATGILSGIEGLGSSLAGKLTGAVGGALGSVKSAFGISSPSKVFADQVGKPMGEGVIQGWLESSASLPSAMSQGLRNAINAGRAVIQAAQASFQTAWQQIASDADKAFAGIHGAKQTSAEKALAGAQSAHDKAGRDQALTAAQGALDTANASGDPAAILAAQQQLEDAKYQIHIAALQKTAAAQRLQLDARNTLEQRHFDAALTNLQEHLAKGHSTYEEAHKAILKLFKTFGVNYSNAGADLGAAFVTGLKESIQGAAQGSGSLSGKLTDVAAGIKIPHAATGGFVAQSGVAVIHKGETITPAGKGGGVTVVVNGWVGNDQDIAEKIKNVLIRQGRNTTGGAFGRFA